VQLRLASGPKFEASGHFYQQSRTDDAGRYEFRGVVVGAHAEVSVLTAEDPFSGAKIEPLEVRSAEPVAMPDIIIPKPKEKPGKQPRRDSGLSLKQ
jgi:hypothetical protein